MKIYIVCEIPFEHLPPALSLINCLDELNYDISIIVPRLNQKYKEDFDEKKIEYNELCDLETYNKKCNNALLVRKLLYKDFPNYVFGILKNADLKKDIVWVLHEETAAKLDSRIFGFNYIVTIYELRKNIKKMRVLNTNLLPVVKNAAVVVTPEYNRSHVLYAWWNLKNVPEVIPNKPYSNEEMILSNDVEKVKRDLLSKLNGRKMVLYQGAFGKDRRLEPFIDAVLAFDKYAIVLMGMRNAYLESLINKYGDKIIYVEALKAPLHMKITEMASIGVVSYCVTKNEYDPLNVVFCAPNKIYEYSKYAVPMLCTKQPGLFYTVEKSGAGICVSDDENEIADAINKIDKNYEKYSKAALEMYKSVDIKKCVLDIINKVI